MTELLCDKRIEKKTKGKVFQMVVRPGMIYDSEIWSIVITKVKKFDTAETRLLSDNAAENDGKDKARQGHE